MLCARDVVTQSQELAELQHVVSHRTAHVDIVLSTYEKQLAEQHSQLTQQDEAIQVQGSHELVCGLWLRSQLFLAQRLTGSRLKHDAVVDLALLFLAMWGSRLVSTPISVIARLLSMLPILNRHPGRAARLLARLGHLAALVFLVHTMRAYAQRAGIHYHMGSLSSYTSGSMVFLASMASSLPTYVVGGIETLRHLVLGGQTSLPPHGSPASGQSMSVQPTPSPLPGDTVALPPPRCHSDGSTQNNPRRLRSGSPCGRDAECG